MMFNCCLIIVINLAVSKIDDPPREHCCFSLVISILISFQLVFMMLSIFSSILVIVRERFLKIVLF